MGDWEAGRQGARKGGKDWELPTGNCCGSTLERLTQVPS